MTSFLVTCLWPTPVITIGLTNSSFMLGVDSEKHHTVWLNIHLSLLRVLPLMKSDKHSQCQWVLQDLLWVWCLCTCFCICIAFFKNGTSSLLLHGIIHLSPAWNLSHHAVMTTVLIFIVGYNENRYGELDVMHCRCMFKCPAPLFLCV